MGRGDRRNSNKMKRTRNRNKRKARLKRALDAKKRKR